MLHIRRALFAATFLGVLALVPHRAAFAGQPPTQTLNPPPPSFETCMAVGNGTICQGDRTESYGPEDTSQEGGALVCGSGASAFDIWDAGTYDQAAIRYYDQNGNLTRRVIHSTYSFGQFSNPLAGTAVPYTQHNTTTDILAVPGDFSTATETNTGEVNFTVPHMGAVFLNAGRTVTAPGGTLEFRAGPQGFIDYFVNGNAGAIEELCAALA